MSTESIDRETKALGRPFRVFMGGFYSAGLGVLCNLFETTNLFSSPDMGIYKIALFGIAGFTTIYYFFNKSKFDDLFINLNIGYHDRYPMLKWKKRNESSIIYSFRIPPGICIDDFEKHKKSFENFLGHKIDIRYTYKEIVIEEFIKSEKTNIPYEVVRKRGNVIIVIGYTRDGRLVTCDLSHGEPHMLIAGETGSGKSTILRSIITNLIITTSVKMHLCDLKNGTEFRLFEKCGSVKSFARNIASVKRLLSDLIVEVDLRYDAFYKYDVVDIEEYNRLFPKSKFDYEVLVIDEFADLQNDKDVMHDLEELGRKARACGIYMILATQRPDHKVLSGGIKANVTNVLGLKTTNALNSNIILDAAGLEDLRGAGHGIFKRGGKLEYIQAPNLTTDNAKDLLRPFYIEKKGNETKIEETVLQDLSFLDKFAHN